jgi:hypothetical protein
MQKNVLKHFFNKIFKRNSNKKVNIVTGGHLSIVKDLKNYYLEFSAKCDLNNLIIITDEETKSNNDLIKYFQVSKNGEKIVWDNFIDYLNSNNYVLNKLIHLDHMVAFNPLNLNENNISNFVEYSNLARVNINNPLTLNSLVLSNHKLLLDPKRDNSSTSIFHMIQPKTFDTEKYFKPNKMLLSMLQGLESSKQSIINEKKVTLGLLSLRTTDKEYISQLKLKYSENIGEAEIEKLFIKIQEFEGYYNHSLNLLLYILSNDFTLKFEDEGKLLDVKNFLND